MSAVMEARRGYASAHRRAMLAKVHIAKSQLRMTDDDYVAVLIRIAGVDSAGRCSDGELALVLKEFERLGFTAKARDPKKAGAPKPADHPAARKARAVWISLHQLGAIDNPSEAALEAFARRQLKCERLQWADQALTYRLIEALKAIAERHGWSHDLEGVKPGAKVLVLKRRLVEAIVQQLRLKGLVPMTWPVERAAHELTGYQGEALLFASTEELDRVARGLGGALRQPIRPVSAVEVQS